MAAWFDLSDLAVTPHGVCLSWNPALLLTHALSDVLMGLSYIAIAGTTFVFGRKRPDMGSPALFNMLALVFAACGVVHFSDVLVLFTPAYLIQGAGKAVAALSSVATVAVIWRLMPAALRLPSVAQLRQINQALESTVALQRAAEARLRLFFQAVEQSSAAVVITDPDGVIEYVNPRFSELSGYAADDAVGKTPRILRSAQTPQQTYADLWGCLAAGRPWRGEFEDQRKDGRPFWVTTTISPVRDQDGRTLHYVAMQEDVTERKLAEIRLREAHELAEVANRAKTQLIANMSHELRTPLNAIIGFSRALLDGALGAVENPRHREYLADISGSGEHLLSLINDILDVSAIEVGKLNLREEPVDLTQVVGVSVRMVTPRAQAGGLEIAAELPPDLPRLSADPRRLKQVVVNLLSNAVKFTPAGGRVTVTAGREAGGGLVLTVGDTGIGMDEDDLAKAMTPFGQVDSSLARRYEGTGLGLPLSKGLVEAHGGSLRVRSVKGAGTEVSVHLPPERLLVFVTE